MPSKYSNLVAIGSALATTLLVFSIGHSQAPAAPNTTSNQVGPQPNQQPATRVASGEAAKWVAAAPGRVEPRTGDIKIAAAAPGRISQVLVKAGDQVAAGEILIRFNSEEAEARLRAADAEVNARKRDRDVAPILRGGEERRSAEDAVTLSERGYMAARDARDRMIEQLKAGQVAEADLQKAVADLATARTRLDKDRDLLRSYLNGTKASTNARTVDWALAAARANLSLADADLERTRLRAPQAMTVLQVIARSGEFVAAAPEQPLVVLGDLSRLRVRAELDERDVGKLSIGQPAVIKADAYRNNEFEGQVVSIAPALGPPRIGPRGPRKPTDVDVLEVLIELAPGAPLLPNMRVDVYFWPINTARAGASGEATK